MLETLVAPEAPVWPYNLPVPAGWPSTVVRVAPKSVNKGRTFPPEVLTAEEVRALLRAASPRSSSGIRARALIVVMWRGGLRIAETLNLVPHDVDPTAGTVNVRRGKGGKQRIIGLDPDALAVLELWLARRRRLGLTARHPIFATYSRGQSFGRPVSQNQVSKQLKSLAARAGITKRVHPHGLRHTHAFELAQEGVPMHVIKEQLGHANLATTARYIDHLCPTQVIEAMRGRKWSLD